MKNIFVKIGAFLLYLFMMALPVLYWISSNWGFTSVFNAKIFSDLLKNDISFQLTLVSYLIAVGIGIKMILLKKTVVVNQANDNISDISNQPVEMVDGLVPMDKVNPDEQIPDTFSNNFSVPPKAPPPIFNSASMNFAVPETASEPRINSNFDVPSFDDNINYDNNQFQQPVDNQISVPNNFSAPVNNNSYSNNTASSEPNIIMNKRYRRNITSITDAFEDPNKFFNNILKTKGYKSFDVKEIEGFDLAFFAVSNKNIVIGYHMQFPGEIIANDTISNTENVPYPYWFSEMKRFISPIWAISKIRESVDNLMLEVLPKNHDITIESYCIINDNAVITNISDCQQSWVDAGINVVMNTVSNNVLPSFNEVIDDVSTVEIMPAFLEFAETLSKYYIQKARIRALKKA